MGFPMICRMCRSWICQISDFRGVCKIIMVIKRINAILSLISVMLLIVHIGYSAFAYLTFYYNPMLKMLTAYPFIVAACLHAVFGMCAVFLQGDGTRLDVYWKQNCSTLIQRLSAALIFPLLIIHLNNFNLLKSSAEQNRWLVFALLIFVQVVFYAVMIAHVATSFSKALITLGILADRKRQKNLDKLVYILCAAMFLLISVAVVRGELMMFLHA